MASYDQLSAQQRAIVDLILKRGQSYGQLAETLDMPEVRVRELASEALTSLAPVSAGRVDDQWRAKIADYLLDQQAGSEADATRDHLRESEAGRAWAGSVLDSLEHLYAKGNLPEIPSAGRAPSATVSKPKLKSEKPSVKSTQAAKPSAPLTPEAAAIVRRRRIFAGAAAAVVLLFVVLIWPVGLVTGGDDQAKAAGPCAEGAEAGSVGQVVLEPVKKGGKAAGVADVTNTGDGCEMRIIAKLPVAKKNQAYEVWLVDGEDARTLGAQVTDKEGNFAGAAALPENFKDYRYIEITRETVDVNAAQSGDVVLRAETSAIRQQVDQDAGAGSEQATPDGESSGQDSTTTAP